MPYFKHDSDESVDISPATVVFLERAHLNDSESLVAFIWRPSQCVHATPLSSGDPPTAPRRATRAGALRNPISGSASLSFSPVGVCRDGGQGREALYGLPVTKEFVPITQARNEELWTT